MKIQVFNRLTRSQVALATMALSLALAAQQPAKALELVAPGETQVFGAWDRCEGTPVTNTVWQQTSANCTDGTRELQTFAVLTVSAINRDVTSSATALMDFDVTSAGEPTVLDAAVSANVDWNGVLFGAGLLGAGAAVEVEMSLVDLTTGSTKGRVVVFEKEQDSTGLKGVDVGGTVFSGSRRVSFPASVVRGHEHSIRITVTCTAQSGLVGASIGCLFDNDVLALGLGVGDRFVRWSDLTLTVAQDAIETLSRLETKIDALTAKVDQLLAGQTLLQAGQVDLKTGQAALMADHLEIIRILNTPTGLRDIETPPPCRGQGCKQP